MYQFLHGLLKESRISFVLSVQKGRNCHGNIVVVSECYNDKEIEIRFFWIDPQFQGLNLSFLWRFRRSFFIIFRL